MLYDGSLLVLALIGCGLLWNRPFWGFWLFVMFVLAGVTMALNTVIQNEYEARARVAAAAVGRTVVHIIQPVPPTYNWLRFIWYYVHWPIVVSIVTAGMVVVRKLSNPTRYGGIV